MIVLPSFLSHDLDLLSKCCVFKVYQYTFVVMKVTYMDFDGSYVMLLLCQYDVNTLHFDLY